MYLDCKQLVKGMLTVKPSERFTVYDIINHKWFHLNTDANESQDMNILMSQIENM